MQQAADAAKVHTAIGLQLRGSPTVKRARDLLEGGAIGRLLSANIYSSTAGFGPEVPGPYVYLENPRNFANLVIPSRVLIRSIWRSTFWVRPVSSIAWCRASTLQSRLVSIRRSASERHMTIFCFKARRQRSVSICMEVAGGRNPEAPFRFEVVGESGTLSLQGGLLAVFSLPPAQAFTSMGRKCMWTRESYRAYPHQQ